MASKARKERRRLEREQRLAEAVALKTYADQLVDKAADDMAQEYGMLEEVEPPQLVQIVKHERPPMISRAEAETALNGQTYEEANWAKLSPAYREAHNRLRQQRGMSTIPPPAIDLYRPPVIRKADPKELEALEREQQIAKSQFLGQQRFMGPPTHEGFTLNGEPVKF
jgi:hypothetical protein